MQHRCETHDVPACSTVLRRTGGTVLLPTAARGARSAALGAVFSLTAGANAGGGGGGGGPGAGLYFTRGVA